MKIIRLCIGILTLGCSLQGSYRATPNNRIRPISPTTYHRSISISPISHQGKLSVDERRIEEIRELIRFNGDYLTKKNLTADQKLHTLGLLEENYQSLYRFKKINTRKLNYLKKTIHKNEAEIYARHTDALKDQLRKNYSLLRKNPEYTQGVVHLNRGIYKEMLQRRAISPGLYEIAQDSLNDLADASKR